MVIEFYKWIIDKLIKGAYILLTAALVQLVIGGWILSVSEVMSPMDAYYVHFAVFIGNTPPPPFVLETLCGKFIAVFDAFLGWILIPALIALLVDRVEKEIMTKRTLKYQLTKMGVNLHLPVEEAEELADLLTEEIEKKIEKKKNH